MSCQSVCALQPQRFCDDALGSFVTVSVLFSSHFLLLFLFYSAFSPKINRRLVFIEIKNSLEVCLKRIVVVYMLNRVLLHF